VQNDSKGDPSPNHGTVNFDSGVGSPRYDV